MLRLTRSIEGWRKMILVEVQATHVTNSPGNQEMRVEWGRGRIFLYVEITDKGDLTVGGESR